MKIKLHSHAHDRSGWAARPPCAHVMLCYGPPVGKSDERDSDKQPTRSSYVGTLSLDLKPRRADPGHCFHVAKGGHLVSTLSEVRSYLNGVFS